jgi:uncharacterized protein (UPF0332 family)
VPTTSEHRARAEQNLRFAESFDLDSTPYLDWVVAAYFYAALHWVDALLFEKEGLNPDNHEIRRAYVREKWYLRGISYEYRSLKDRSEDARYRLLTFTRSKIEREVIPPYRAIEQHIIPQLTPQSSPKE